MASTVEARKAEQYERVAAAIAFLQQHHQQQPSLAEIAKHVALSEYHFQRMFTQWAGISPKRFLQYLTVEHAKARLLDAQSLLNLSADVGLSSPSRLHDLFVTLEAMSPGEYRAGGRGLTLRYGTHDTWFGPVLIATTERGICSLHFLQSSSDSRTQAAALLAEQWPNATRIYDEAATESPCRAIFEVGKVTQPQPLTVLVKGTNFQIQVWRALLTVPLGTVTTYSAIASLIDSPKAVRAVGTAIGRNPIGYLIPCHRVIRGSGQLGGYRWGIERKAAILGWEASQIKG